MRRLNTRYLCSRTDHVDKGFFTEPSNVVGRTEGSRTPGATNWSSAGEASGRCQVGVRMKGTL